MKPIPVQRRFSSNRAKAKTTSSRTGRLKIAKILVPIDFSTHSESALKHAIGLARQFGASVTVLHVVEQIFYPRDWMYPFTTVDFPERCKVLSEKLSALAKKWRVKARSVVLLGSPWNEIVDFATRQKIDLIVIGTHGYTGLKHALVGSVAERVVRGALCPVLTVRMSE